MGVDHRHQQPVLLAVKNSYSRSFLLFENLSFHVLQLGIATRLKASLRDNCHYEKILNDFAMAGMPLARLIIHKAESNAPVS